jgi:hypothetical protein
VHGTKWAPGVREDKAKLKGKKNKKKRRWRRSRR